MTNSDFLIFILSSNSHYISDSYFIILRRECPEIRETMCYLFAMSRFRNRILDNVELLKKLTKKQQGLKGK